jgi:hypothetical protein
MSYRLCKIGHTSIRDYRLQIDIYWNANVSVFVYDVWISNKLIFWTCPNFKSLNPNSPAIFRINQQKIYFKEKLFTAKDFLGQIHRNNWTVNWLIIIISPKIYRVPFFFPP